MPYLMRVLFKRAGLLCRASGETHSVCVHQRLVSSFVALRHPIVAKTTYSHAVREFTGAAILGYECGLTEASLRQFLQQQPVVEVRECVEMVCLVWITLLLSHKAATRWSLSDPVSQDTLKRCQGFVELMVIAYFEKGMIWIPIERLQLEQTAVNGKAESTEHVAEKERIVFTTLETVAPQFPSL